MHNIDLSKYEVRTDMAVDLLDERQEKYDNYTYEDTNIKISKCKLDENNVINKKKGTYITLEFDDITDDNYKKKVSEVLKIELKKMLNEIGFNKQFKTVIVGLGNIKVTPDSLGPLVSDKIIVTSHFFDMNIDVEDKFSNVSAFYPGVTGTTGIETSDYIKGVIDKISPDLVIVVDALASSSISRVNKSIQISDTGISPGSGIGNKRKEISKETLNIPVIAIGVPTVTSASQIVCDTINYMIKNYSYNKKLSNKKVSKFLTKNINYANKDINITDDDRKTLLGLVGLLDEEELKELTYEVLTPIGYNLMVCPKEADFVIEKLSDIISYGINNSLHNI